MLFDPARLPARDDFGFTSHPDIPEVEDEVPMTPYFADLGFQLSSVLADDEAAGNKELEARLEQYYELSESSIAFWTPSPPSTEPDWLLASIHDTESGPCAWYVMPLLPEVIRRNQALREMDLAYARRAFPTATCDEVLIMSLHKARYECTHLHRPLRLQSGDWLRERKLKRFSGFRLLPPGQLPS